MCFGKQVNASCGQCPSQFSRQDLQFICLTYLHFVSPELQQFCLFPYLGTLFRTYSSPQTHCPGLCKLSTLHIPLIPAVATVSGKEHFCLSNFLQPHLVHHPLPFAPHLPCLSYREWTQERRQESDQLFFIYEKGEIYFCSSLEIIHSSS